MGSARVTPKVHKYLTERPGETVYIEDIAKATGLLAAQVQASIRSLVLRDGLPIETVQRGASWIFNPKKVEDVVPRKKHFTELGTSKAGELIIEDDKGVLYIAKEL